MQIDIMEVPDCVVMLLAEQCLIVRTAERLNSIISADAVTGANATCTALVSQYRQLISSLPKVFTSYFLSALAHVARTPQRLVYTLSCIQGGLDMHGG